MSRNESDISPTWYLVAYLVMIALLAVVGLVARVWLFFWIGAVLVNLVWLVASLSRESKRPRAKAVWTFFGWQLPILVLVFVLLVLDIDPIAGYWSETWPALLCLGLFLAIGAISLFAMADDVIGALVVALAFLGVIGLLFAIPEPPLVGAGDVPLWLYDYGATIAIVCFLVAAICALGRMVYETTTHARPPKRYKGQKRRVTGGVGGGPFGVLLDQLVTVLNVVLFVLDFIWQGVILWVLRYLYAWLRELPRGFTTTAIAVLRELITLLRCVLFQAPVHILAAFGLWLFAVHLGSYLYEGESFWLVSWAGLRSFVALSACFIVGFSLLLWKDLADVFPTVLANLAEVIQESIPHGLVVFVGTCWTLIALTWLFGLGRFSIGVFTVLLTGFLVVGLIWAALRRQRGARTT